MITYETMELMMHADGIEITKLHIMFIPLLGHTSRNMHLLWVLNMNESMRRLIEHSIPQYVRFMARTRPWEQGVKPHWLLENRY